jgi:hypothetical protein
MTVDSYVCPTCGSEVKVGAPCPGCAPKRPKAKARVKSARRPRKSWEQDSTYDGLDLPEEDFDYDEFVAREFGGKPHQRVGLKWYWWLTGVALLGAFLIWVLGGIL